MDFEPTTADRILRQVENVIMLDSEWGPLDIDDDYGIFSGMQPGLPVEPIHFSTARDLPNLLKDLRVYESTSEARRAGRDGPIPPGWSEMKASKRRTLWIWNPTEPLVEFENDCTADSSDEDWRRLREEMRQYEEIRK